MQVSHLQVQVQLDETASDILYRDNAKLYFQASRKTSMTDDVTDRSTHVCSR